jgi:hypothetical protein
MIDTVSIKHFFPKPLADDELRERGARLLQGRRHKTWALNSEESDGSPRITVTFPPAPVMHVSAEFSVPKLLFGHNARLPNSREVAASLITAERYVEERIGLRFAAATATVSQVDYAADLDVGEDEANKATYELYNRSLPRFRRMLFEGTLYFKSKTVTIRFYSKLGEVVSKAGACPEAIRHARGKLRAEYSVKGRGVSSLAKRRGLPDKSVTQLLRESVSDAVLAETLEKLSYTTPEQVVFHPLEKLLSMYSVDKACGLFGFLEMVKTRGEKFYLDPAFKCSKRSYDRRARECRRAKVWATQMS